jgi:hypothetical protein
MSSNQWCFELEFDAISLDNPNLLPFKYVFTRSSLESLTLQSRLSIYREVSQKNQGSPGQQFPRIDHLFTEAELMGHIKNFSELQGLMPDNIDHPCPEIGEEAKRKSLGERKRHRDSPTQYVFTSGFRRCRRHYN